MMHRLIPRISLLIFLSFLISKANATEDLNKPSTPPLPDRIIGDVGLAIYSNTLNIGQSSTQSVLLPYGFFDYKRFAMRIDQLAFKTLPIGYGYLELVGKIDPDSYKIKSTVNGQTISKGYQVPIGLGSFQETPIGVISLNAYRDIGPSHGYLYDLTYYGELDLSKKLVLYPQLGLERQSQSYTNYYFGINREQAQQTGYTPFEASASNNPFAGVLLEYAVADNWYLNMYGKRKWLGSGSNHSPVLTRSYQDTIFMSLIYRYK
jgi:outer membrane protein